MHLNYKQKLIDEETKCDSLYIIVLGELEVSVSPFINMNSLGKKISKSKKLDGQSFILSNGSFAGEEGYFEKKYNFNVRSTSQSTYLLCI